MEVFHIKDFLINEQINFNFVQVIDEEGQKLPKMSTKEAIELAYSKNLDLVLVSPNVDNPVCKLLDYSKYKFEMNKKAKEAKKKQKVIDTKEVRLSPVIDKHDLEVKFKMAEKFLSNGDKVKVVMRFKGRQLNFINQGKEIMLQFKDMLTDCIIEKDAKIEGKNLIMFLAPKKV
jgi:translation initiation factor IF-3